MYGCIADDNPPAKVHPLKNPLPLKRQATQSWHKGYPVQKHAVLDIIGSSGLGVGISVRYLEERSLLPLPCVPTMAINVQLLGG